MAARGVSAGMWVLDLPSLVWERIGEPDEGAWPGARYFHTVDYWRGKLVLFGGMGVRGTGAASDETLASGTTPTTTTPCVLDDLWVYDIDTRTWEECAPDLPQYTSAPPSPVSEEEQGPVVVPRARYAHLSAVVGDRLIVTGGQEISNE